MTIPLFEVLERMYRLAVWDAKGRMYMPIFDYDFNNVEVYAPADEAINANFGISHA